MKMVELLIDILLARKLLHCPMTGCCAAPACILKIQIDLIEKDFTP